MEAIAQLRGRTTTIAVAHRLSSLRNCDRIICLEQGRIVAEGSFEALMQGRLAAAAGGGGDDWSAPSVAACMTALRTRPALFVQYSADRGGSPISGLAVVERLQQHGLSVHAVFGGDGPMQRVYADRGCRLGRVDHGAWLGGGSLPRKVLRLREELVSVLRFRRLIRSLGVKLVYVNTIMGSAAILAARLERVPCVWHLRELLGTADTELRGPVIGLRATRRALRLATRTVCISGLWRRLQASRSTVIVCV